MRLWGQMAQEYVLEGVGRASSLQGYRRRVIFQGQNLLEMEPEERAKAVCFWRFSTRWKFRREQFGFLACGIQSRRKQHGLGMDSV